MILGRRSAPPPLAPYRGTNLKDRLASLPEGIRIYAIGDIHGQLGLLQRIHEQIDEVEQRNPAREIIEITLGDQIDRGWNSRGVIDRLIERAHSRRLYVLQGNHERTLLRTLEDPGLLPFWLRYGGVETLLSYGVKPSMPLDPVGLARTVAALHAALPPDHLAFLKAMQLHHTIGEFTFVHAGLRPGRALDQQRPQDLTEIREPFLKHAGDFGSFIVHGHTPVEQVDIRPNRINLDTGAYATGRLSCLIIEKDGLALTSSAR